MRFLLSDSNRQSPLLAALCLVLASCLGGCASKNPLIDEAPVASTAKPATMPTGNTESVTTAAANNDVQTVTASRTKRFFGIFSPYRVDIQQGNFVSREMMIQLKEAMSRKEGVTRDQARFILGTPLMTDIFHADRWDYVFRLQKGNGDLITSHVTLFFKGNRLENFDGSLLPTERDYLALLVGAPAKEPSAAPEAAPTPAAPSNPPQGK
jgi:outer membrane protein assembly factor BamE